jgi:hypothetical protein
MLILLSLASTASLARAQGPFTAEVLKESPPATLSAAIKAELNPTGYRVVDGKGMPFADIGSARRLPHRPSRREPTARSNFRS